MQAEHFHRGSVEQSPHLASQSFSRLRPAEVSSRLHALAAMSANTCTRTQRFIALAKQGLPAMRAGSSFVHTVRRTPADFGHLIAPEGDSLRYTLIAALGLSLLSDEGQREILDGCTAKDFILGSLDRAEQSKDPGAVALAAWATAEVAGLYAGALFARLRSLLSSNVPISTVDCAWALIAALAARDLGPTTALVALMRGRLLAAQSPSGLFPHWLSAAAAKRFRAHVGCFADQVYPIQALSRLSVAMDDVQALDAAELCAKRICALQGPAGQWWWHYDTRNGSVVEGYPVYSVHQHAMAPMALLELSEAGGQDRIDALTKGLYWLDDPPEVGASLVSEEHGVIWRKVARREPKKTVRALAASATALRPGLRLPGLDTIFPPVRIDYECRPYELGWLIYAWLGGSRIDQPRLDGTASTEQKT